MCIYRSLYEIDLGKLTCYPNNYMMNYYLNKRHIFSILHKSFFFFFNEMTN